jgi:hypothetical protein
MVRVFCPIGQKLTKIFFNKKGQSLHQSKALVEFSRNMLLLNFFEVLAKKILKTMLKYIFLNDVVKYHVLDLKSVKNEGF